MKAKVSIPDRDLGIIAAIHKDCAGRDIFCFNP